MRGTIPPHLYAPSWRGAQLKHRDIFSFTFNFTFTGVAYFTNSKTPTSMEDSFS